MGKGRYFGSLLAVLAGLTVMMSVLNLNADDRGLVATAGDEASQEVPLYTNLGSHHYAISTDVPKAQAYFDQGLRLYYAFNHAEAIRSFREAQRLDPHCAMCWWGEALAWGPNINLPMDRESGIAAYKALQGARARRENATEIERALIDALVVRYEEDPPEDRTRLDEAYANAMREVARRFSSDNEAVVLYAESQMDLRPWDYWMESGQPYPGIADALRGLERVIEVDRNHPGACHFFIHAVEKLYPERAVPCAERLANLMPGAGHLVHMPGHIYIRVGRYLDAFEANQHAIHADETYIRDQNPAFGMYTGGYYPHNYDFLAFAALMIGRSADAIEAADRVVTLIPPEMIGAPGMDFLEHWTTRGLQMRVRFGRWDDLLAIASPSEELPHAKSMWHYARGRALAAKGDVAGAREQLQQMRTIMKSGVLDGVGLEFNTSLDVLGIAESVLEGWIEAAAGRHAAAVAALTEAVRREDALLYGEPPEWTVPTRQDLGYVLLEAKRFADAERIFREDLAKFPANGWSLYGLSQALREQKKAAEAGTTEAEFKRVWATADVDVNGWRSR